MFVYGVGSDGIGDGFLFGIYELKRSLLFLLSSLSNCWLQRWRSFFVSLDAFFAFFGRFYRVHDIVKTTQKAQVSWPYRTDPELTRRYPIKRYRINRLAVCLSRTSRSSASNLPFLMRACWISLVKIAPNSLLLPFCQLRTPNYDFCRPICLRAERRGLLDTRILPIIARSLE
jgi:hypothetical protein